MMKARRNQPVDGTHRFGGDWTESKLVVIEQYLAGYTNALKGQRFRKAYIDAFAGTGSRTARDDDNADDASQPLLFPELAEPAAQGLLDGSARRALRVKPRFDKYIFIERSTERCTQLEALKTEFAELASDIEIHQGDANDEIRALCAKDWTAHRAVLFLDPYGMQVEWQTIEAVANTKAIDLWLLFPLGTGLNRLLTRSGEIPAPWRRRLDLLLGTTDWYDELYQIETERNLFGEDEARLVKVTMDTMGRYFNNRLKQVFAGVVDEPGVLRNSTNNPLYLLCFAVGNQRGKPVALRIANHLLKDLH